MAAQREDLQLDDFVYIYPQQADEQIQAKLAERKEFHQLMTLGGVIEGQQLPARGEFFAHQTFAHRLLEVINNVLLIYPTGSGKTCAAGGKAEQLRVNFMAGAINYVQQYLTGKWSNIRHVYIIVPGKTIEAEFKRQIICKCSAPGAYQTPHILAADKISTRDTRINKELAKFYTITTPTPFVNKILEKGWNDEDISREFSGSLFIVDEAHKLRLQEEKIRAEMPEEEEEEVEEVEKKDDKETKKKTRKERNYDMIKKVFSVVQRSKIVLMTATPMINAGNEIAYIMNLILPPDLQMNPEWNYNILTLQQLKPYFMGRISFVPELETGVNVIYHGEYLPFKYEIGDTIYDSKTKVMVERMKGRLYEPLYDDKNNIYPGQLDGYTHARDNPGRFRINERQALNFAYPDGSYGKKGFKKYIKEVKEGTRTRYVASDSLKPWLSNIDYLAYRSQKYARILGLIQNATGKVFCYSDFLMGSGMISFSLILEAHGYERFDQEQSIFVGQARQGLPPLCDDPAVSTALRRATITPKKRYTLLAGETAKAGSKRQNVIIETFNSRENRHGEYIQIILSTPIAQLGLSFSDVTDIHIFEPGWTAASRHQAKNRPIRATSHIDLLQEKKEQAALINAQAGQMIIDPNTIKVNVNIYQHASVVTDDLSAENNGDVAIYKIAEEKGIGIDRIMYFMKRASVDCLIHRLRQVRPGQSSTLHYFPTDYTCINSPPTGPLITDSYNMLYSTPNIKAAIELISSLMKKYSIYSIYDINSAVQRKDQTILADTTLTEYDFKLLGLRFLILAALQLISEKIVLYDRWGYDRYLGEEDGILYLSDKYPVAIATTNLLDTMYIGNMFLVERINLSQFSRLQKQPEQKETLAIIQALDPQIDLAQLQSIILNLDIYHRAQLVEWAIDHSGQPLANNIKVLFANSIFEDISEPTGLIKIVSDKLRTDVVRRGRPRDENKEITYTYSSAELENTANYDDQSKFVIHNVLSLAPTEAQYNVSNKIMTAKGPYRLKSVGTDQWRDPTALENVAYTAQLKMISSIRLTEGMGSLFGTLNNNVFRIVDKGKERQDRPGDGRTIRRGKNCSAGFKIPELMIMLWRLEISAPELTIDIPSDQIMISTLSNTKLGRNPEINLQTLSHDDLVFYYKWNIYISQQTQAKIPVICQIIRQEFEQRGLIKNI